MSKTLLHEIVIWPHRSLDRAGIFVFLKVLVGMMAFWALAIIFIPRPYPGGENPHMLLAMIIIPPFVLVFLGMALALVVSTRVARRYEMIRFYETEMSVERVGWPRPSLPWCANPYWVHVRIDNDTRIENRLTLRDRSGRGVSVGEFLSPDERVDLSCDLRALIQRLKTGDLETGLLGDEYGLPTD